MPFVYNKCKHGSSVSCLYCKLQRAVLWSGCCHHIGKVVISYVFTDRRSKHHNHWTSHSSLNYVVTRTWWLSVWEKCTFQPADHSPEAQAPLKTMADESTACIAEVIDFVRDDYEFTQLMLNFLGANEAEVQFRRLGALHKARWMSKLIYCLKISLLEKSIEHLPPGTITSRHQVLKVRAFGTFITHVYCKWWLTYKKAVDAPWNDLQLLKRLRQYDKYISESAVRAFHRHLWYLTAEMVPLSLSNTLVPSSECQAIVDESSASQ